MIKFKPGKTYSMRSICDHDCIWHCEIISRTAKFVTLKIEGDRTVVRCGVTEMDDSERCYPSGKYSMAPVLRAESKEE